MSSVKVNFFYNVIYQILSLIVPLILTPYISRVLGAEGLGIYSYLYSIVHFFALFGVLGLKNYGNRSIATARDDKLKLSKTFSSIYSLQLMTTFASLALYIMFIVFFLSEYIDISLILTIVIVSTLFDVSWFVFGIENFKASVFRNIAIKVLNVICVFIFVKDANDLWIYTLIMSLGALISQIILWLYIRKKVDFTKPTLREVLTHLRPNLILFIPVISVSIYKTMDKVLLGSLSNMVDVGYYSNAEKMIVLALGVVTAFGTVMLPKMSNLVSKGSTEIKEYIRISMQFIIFMSSPLAFGLSAIAPTFAPLFFGNEFIIVGDLIPIMSVSVFFVAYGTVIRNQFLVPYQKDGILMKSVLLGAVINFVLNILLIPILNVYGTVLAAVVTEFTVFFYQAFKVRKELDFKTYFKEGYMFIVNGFLMFAGVRLTGGYLDHSVMSLVIQIILGAVFYVLLCCLYFMITRKRPLFLNSK